MSSFTEYHKKWKEENGRGEDNPYKQRSLSEIQESTQQYLDSMYGSQGKIWEKIQNRANINLNQSNNMQKVIDANTRNQMARNMEDYVSTKRTAMQSVSNAIQENAKKREQVKQENKTLIDQANEQFRKQHPSTVNTNQKQNYEVPKAEVKLADTQNLKDLKVLKSGDMFKLTDGEVDDRSNLQKVTDSGSGIAGNLAMGVESVIPSVTKYINTGGEIATAKAGSQIMQKLFNTDKDVADSIGEQVFSKMWELTDISKANKELNSEEMETWRSETINNNIKKTDTPLGKKVAEIVPSVGQNIIPMAVSYFNPVAGTALFMSSAAGSYLKDAEDRGMNKEQAFTYATVMGTFEGTTEQVITGKMLSNSMKLFNGVGLSDEVLNSFGVSTAENFLQEAIMEPLQETTATVIGGKDKANWENILNRSLEAGVDGVLSSIILNGASVGIASASNVVNKKNPSQTEIQLALEDTINSGKVDLKGIIEGAKEAIKQGKDFINSDYNTLLQQNSTNNQINSQTQQTTNQENKMAQNGNMEQIENTQQNVDYNNSNYFQTAKNYNLDTNNETVKGIYNVTSKRGINVIWDDTTFTSSKQNAKWIIDNEGNRSVILNPKANTDTALQNVMMHELTHDIGRTKEYDRISSMVLERLKSSNDYDNMMLDIANAYKNEYNNMSKEQFNKMIEQEAIADYLGENLGNQEFVNDLVRSTDRTQVQKIIDWVRNKVASLKNVITGNKELNYWNNIKENFERAYNQEYQGDNLSERFSIQTDNNGNQYVKVDTDQNIFEGIDRKDYNKIAKMYIEDYLMGETTLSNTDTAIIDKKSSKKYTNPGKTQNKFYEKMKLTPELKNALEISEKVSQKLPIKPNSKYASWEYYKFNFELDGKNFEGLINIGIDSNKNKHFYEINNIREISILGTSLDNRTDFSNNSILPTKENVNSNTNNKYIQESENNSSSFNLPISDKFSKQSNGLWKQYLKDTSINKGTKESLKDIRIPINENLRNNNGIQKENISPYRTMEQIANDNTISDTQAFQEATEQLDTPSDKILQQRKNELSSQGIEKSPTIDYIKKKRSKEKASLKEIKDTLAQKFVNKGHYIDKLAKQIGNDNLTYLYDRTMNTFNEAQISIGDYQINSKGEKVGKSIIDIFEPVNKAKLSLEFDDYLLNKHNMSRYAHEKGLYGNEVSAVDSKRIVEYYEGKYPEFKEWSNEVSKYNDNNLRDLVDNGMVSEDMYKKLKDMYGDYVPTYRDITDNISQYIDDSVGGNTLGKATQSNREILSVSESMAEQTLAIKKAVRINNLGIELYNSLGKNSEIRNTENFDPIAMQTLAGNVIEKATDGTNIFTIFIDGEMKQFRISDDLYTAFAQDIKLENIIKNQKVQKVVKVIRSPIEKVSKAQRELLTTYSIGFALNNPIKDFQDALFNSKYGGATFVKNWTKALYNIGTKGSWYESYKNNGGTANTYFDYSKGILPIKTKNPFKKFTNAIKNVNEVLEQAPRLAEYISTIEHKGSIDEALYNAAEVTTNFKRGGDVTKAVNKYGANFLNASVQGLDKLYRNLSGQRGWKGYANILTKATLYQIAPAIINGLLLGDDEDYEDLPEYTKDNYFLFKMENVISVLPKPVQDNFTVDGKFFRIPKGRVSSVVGGIARRCLEAGQGKEVDWESLVDTTINQLAPNNPLSDNIFAPIVQASNNKTWYGGEIVSNRLKKLPVAEQYDESTDELSKFMGSKLNVSPKKINYVLDQYSGGIGDVLLPIITPQAENNILEDKFTTDAVMKNKHVSEYYSELEELEKNKNSQNATDEDKLKYKYMSEVSKDLSDLYNKKREIQNSSKSDKFKKMEVRQVQKQINDIVEERLEKSKDIKTTNLTAKVGNSEYYKYHNEWTKLSDEEKKKNKNISLTAYADYKNKTYNLTKKKKDSGELKEKGQLKTKDEIEVLLNSKSSDKEKWEIYKKYIGANDKKVELVEKLNFPSNEYLKYKQQDFENDKDKNGRSISGTGKQKVYDYLNEIPSYNLSDNYKKIICKIEGINDYDIDVVNFINDSNMITNNEKREMLKNIGYEIDEDGYVITKSILPLRKYIK